MTRGRKATIGRVDGALSKAPAAPTWLPKEAKTEWRRVVPQLVADRKLAAHELGIVESYCLAVSGIRQAQAAIEANGGPYFTSATGEPKRHPATTLLKESIEAARRLAGELGLTPASRSKNKGGTPGDTDSEFGLDI